MGWPKLQTRRPRWLSGYWLPEPRYGLYLCNASTSSFSALLIILCFWYSPQSGTFAFTPPYALLYKMYSSSWFHRVSTYAPKLPAPSFEFSSPLRQIYVHFFQLSASSYSGNPLLDYLITRLPQISLSEQLKCGFKIRNFYYWKT